MKRYTLLALFLLLLLPTIVQAEDKWNIKTLDSYQVLSDTSNESSILLEGTTAEVYETTGLVAGYYQIDFNGVPGFIYSDQASALFEQEQMSFKVVDEQIPYYVMKKGKLVQKGILLKDAVLTRTKTSSVYHLVEVGKDVFYIPLEGTIPTLSPSNDALKKATYPIKLYNRVEVPVYNTKSIQIGTLAANQSVDLIGVEKSKGIIYFLGQEARINMNDFVHMDLLQPKKVLKYEEMTYLLNVIAALYPEFTRLEQIGKSVEGTPLYAMKIGNGKKEVLLDGSLHAREHMTTNVVAEMIDTYSIHYENKSVYGGYNVRQALDQTAIWFIPMMNPDGVKLVQSGPTSMKNGALATKINGNSNFNRWKSNIRGVDLNDNFASGWDKIKGGHKQPAYMAYKGPSAFSEPESKAFRDFVKKHKFKTYISYHSSGQIMYWFNYQKTAESKRDQALAKTLSKLTGYKVMPPQYLPGSGASADWFIQETKMPGITLEISPYIGEQPVPLSKWDAIWRQNHKVGLYLAQEASKR